MDPNKKLHPLLARLEAISNCLDEIVLPFLELIGSMIWLVFFLKKFADSGWPFGSGNAPLVWFNIWVALTIFVRALGHLSRFGRSSRDGTDISLH